MSAKISYSIALLILLSAIAIAITTGQWHWVARSGSLIVVIGILLTSSQILQNMDRLRLRRSGAEQSADHDWGTKDDMRRLIRKIQTEELSWEAERSGLVLLILGTLVWGFGDLPGTF